MAPHIGAEKFKTIRRDGETMAIPGSKRGREADIGVADGLLTAFKRAIKKTIFRTFLHYPEGNSGRGALCMRARVCVFLSINARMPLIYLLGAVIKHC